MKSTGRIKGIIAATAVLTLLATASASAEDRHRDGTWRDNGSSRNNGSYRDNNGSYRNENHSYRNETRNNNHYSDRGRIRSFTRERDGYRVFVEGARYPYWVPFSRLGRHQLRVGIDIRLGGIFNGTYVDVDALGWPGDPYYNDGYYDGGGYYNDGYADGYLSGRVERMDFRRGTMLLRDDRSGRTVEVDMRPTAGRRGLDFGDLRPGDRVTLQGSWDRGYFHAYRIDGVRQY
ncbi:MAG TPA: hypothetical protein VJZ76_08870 [Thermoanaerobaculia bacterium]|nr:hypothetical protein [Thermoanaerobaculia bacterium]